MDRTLDQARIRPFTPADAESIARHMNDRAIWRNLRDRVPHPYTADHAREFIAAVARGDLIAFAIEVDGAAAGSIGGRIGEDVRRRSFECGFWLGTAHHGRGIVSAVLPVFVEWVFAHLDVCRIEAQVFGWNVASIRVLVKSGFEHEGTLRSAVTKDGATTDLSSWAIVRE
ncbi:MAG: GNAT family N-acetyltransferase [Planctomycetes bacterium]|nr:GNAT family N-acetyltransferase [Planctomycetota bacterium]